MCIGGLLTSIFCYNVCLHANKTHCNYTAKPIRYDVEFILENLRPIKLKTLEISNNPNANDYIADLFGGRI